MRMGTNSMSPCTICKQKNSSSKLDKLRRLDCYLDGACGSLPSGLPDTHIPRPNWAIHHKCKYGISCHFLRGFDAECRRLAQQCEPKMLLVAVYGDDRLFHGTLQFLRGDFPQIYRWLETFRWKYRKQS